MLSSILGSPGDMSRRSVLALEVPDSSQGRYHHDLKAFCESGHKIIKNTIENMARVLFKFIIHHLMKGP